MYGQPKMPWEDDPLVEQQPRRIQGPPREPTPQTPAQSTLDQYQAQAGQFSPAKAAADTTSAQAQAEFARQKAAAEAEKARLEADALRTKNAAGPAGNATESAGQAAGFYQRARLAQQGYGPGVEPRGWMGQMAADALPSGMVNSMTGDDRKNAETYAREFVAATLRRESGAAINPEEYTNQYRRYFPTPGDDAQQIEIKRQLRENAIQALRLQAGNLAGEVDKQFEPQKQGGKSDQPPTFAIGGNPSHPGGMDRTQQSEMQPGGAEVGLGKGTQTIKDPSLRGLNNRVNAMLQRGAPIGKILDTIVAAGVPIEQVMPSINSAAAFRKEHPNYRGKWDVRLDETTVPLSGVNKALNAFTNSGPGTAAGSYINSMTGNHLDNIVNAAGGNGDMTNLGLQALRQEHPNWGIAGDVAAGASLYGAGRAAATKVGSSIAARAPSVAKGLEGLPQFLKNAAADASMGGYVASGSNGTDLADPTNTAMGAGLGAAFGAAGRGAMNTAGRVASPTGGDLAPLYQEGVQPTLGQRMGGIANRAEQAFTSVPIAGGAQRSARNAAIDQAQRGAFNQALREIGTELPPGVQKGVQAHSYMQRAFNQVYDKARSGMTFKPDGEFGQELGQVQQTVKALSSDSQKAFETMVQPVGIRLRARGGALNGDDFKTLSSRINAKVRALRKSPTGDGELADALESFSAAMDDAARRQSSPEAVALLDAADRGYVKSVIIENAARSGAGGEFSGAALENAVKNGAGGRRARVFLRGDAPMQDYAAAFRKLGNTVPDSGTPERLMAAGALGGASLKAPWLVAPWAADTLATLPGLKSVANAVLAPNRPALDPLRRGLIGRSGYAGSMLGLPFVSSLGNR